MSRYSSLCVGEQELNACLGGFVRALLEEEVADAVLVPSRQPYGDTVMQTLVADPAAADAVDPLAPVVPTSSATLLAKLTRSDADRKVAAFLRPCEVRAFVELVKLKQASLDNVLLIGMDCFGRYETTDFLTFVSGQDTPTVEFLKAIHNGRGTEVTDGIDIVAPCKACLTPVAENVDLRLEVVGHEPGEVVGLSALTPAGEEALETLGLAESKAPAEREAAVAALVEKRRAFREALRAEYRDRAKDVEGLVRILSGCINCYNCRVVCPVCYCRECVFVTDTFAHESRQYFAWAEKRGALRLPADTLFYHLTRMAHMSTLCVACGQCSSACPNDLPVSELFSMVGEEAQAVFEYQPGRDPAEEQPMAHFAENELMEVTGQVK